LVVGVLPGQHPEVLQTAASLAKRLALPVICAYVDEASYLVDWDPARTAHRRSLHRDADDAETREATEKLRSGIGANCDPFKVEWTLRVLPGDPARSIGRLAEDANALMIVVGAPERGVGHRFSAALKGSVAAWLSHHQEQPVLIVPAKGK
jgi:nucleotide-binding universal stress UspA family protein